MTPLAVLRLAEKVSRWPRPPQGNDPMPTYGLDRDFPLLWEDVTAFDFAERLGGCTDPRLAEIDKAMRELWDARRYVREGHPS